MREYTIINTEDLKASYKSLTKALQKPYRVRRKKQNKNLAFSPKSYIFASL